MTKDIEVFIKNANAEFDGKLIPKEEQEYIEKILKYAVLFKEYRKSDMIGLIAFYANDHASKRAFLSLLIIEPAYRRQKVAEELLNKATNYCSKIGFKQFDLEVLKTNAAAIQFYVKNGFLEKGMRDDYVIMSKAL